MALRMHIISTGWQFDSSKALRESLQTPAGLTDYICSIDEAREYLNLLLELSQTFETIGNERIEANDLRKVLKLLSIADIQLNDHDRTLARQCSAAAEHITTIPNFDNPYLKAIDRLPDAEYLVGVLADLWTAIYTQRDYTTEALKYERLLDTTPAWRLIKRFRLAAKYQDAVNTVEYWKIHIHGHGIDHMYNPRYISTVNSLYKNQIEYGWPLIFYKSPLQAEQTFFGDAEEEAAVRAEWEQSPLHRFGDERLWRLITLHFGMDYSISFCYPTNDPEKYGKPIPTAEELHRIYPEFDGLFRFSTESIPA